MEHAEALGRIEIAAAEPDGLDRLMAGDTAEAAAIAGHLAGCPACAGELARIRRSSAVVREVIRTQPDEALRARTLAYVRAAGVPRGAEAGAVGQAMPGAALPAGTTSPGPGGPAPLADAGARRVSRFAWLAAAAAVVLLVSGVAFAAVTSVQTATDTAIAAKDREIAVLERMTRATLRVSAAPDARRIPLASASGATEGAGTLLFSPTTGELVAVAEGLVPETDGQEYGCWVEVNGTRERIGKMHWAGDLWAWAGPVDGLADLPAGATFGVSLGPVGGGRDSVPVLIGEL